MEKTIEQRAEEYADNLWKDDDPEWNPDSNWFESHNGYIAGAEDQKEIDSIEFLEWTVRNGIKYDGFRDGEIHWMKWKDASHQNMGTTKELYILFKQQV